VRRDRFSGVLIGKMVLSSGVLGGRGKGASTTRGMGGPSKKIGQEDGQKKLRRPLLRQERGDGGWSLFLCKVQEGGITGNDHGSLEN